MILLPARRASQRKGSDLVAEEKSAVRKEPFDYAVFARMYPNSNGSCRLSPDNEFDCRRYTEMYYADDSVKTISEFVDKLDANEDTA